MTSSFMMKDKHLPDGVVPHQDRPEGLHAGCECGDESVSFAEPFKRGFTRRKVLQGSTAFAAALSVQPLTARFAFAAPAAAPIQRVLINVIWRGGLDQHTWFPLLGNPAYARARPGIKETAQTSFALSRGVGALTEFRPLYTTLGAGGFGYLPAADSQDPTHSHFEATDLLEGGMNTPSSDGWATRALRNLPNPAVLSAVMVGGTLPKSLSGSSALTLDRIQSFGLNGGDEVRAKSEAVLRRFYSQYRDPVASTALETLTAIKTVRTLGQREYQPAAQYPGGGLADAFKTTAQLIKARVGLRFVTLDQGGFDTHTDSRGQLHDHATEANAAMTAFFQDLGSTFRPYVTIVTSTEFGRTFGENGGGGTDHGHAMGMQVLGGGSTGGVRGGDPIVSASGRDNETKGSTDYRDVLTEGLSWLGVRNAASVFPGHRFRPAGAFKT
ncbi:MAG: DUF1501 domain-containing protein [Mycobacteriales bacterium]